VNAEAVLEPPARPDDGVYMNRPGVAVVKWDAELKIVQVVWHGWADPVEFAAITEAGLRALSEHHGSRWLADCRDMKAVQQSDQDWLNDDWFPRALAAGLRRMAVVLPQRGLVTMNLKDILNRVPVNRLDVDFFVTVAEATKWITGPATVPPTPGSATVPPIPDPTG
jgi:hypothetical protein